MHQAFREGFEKVGFLFQSPHEYKEIIKGMGSAVGNRYVKARIASRAEGSGWVPGMLAGGLAKEEQALKKRFPKGTRHPSVDTSAVGAEADVQQRRRGK